MANIVCERQIAAVVEDRLINGPERLAESWRETSHGRVTSFRDDMPAGPHTVRPVRRRAIMGEEQAPLGAVDARPGGAPWRSLDGFRIPIREDEGFEPVICR